MAGGCGPAAPGPARVSRMLSSTSPSASLADAMVNQPNAVADRLQVLTLAGRAIAWLRIDDSLALAEAGGDLEAYGLAALKTGAAACEQAPFLEGLLPLVETPWEMPSVEVGKGRVADLHFWECDGG